MKFMGSNRNILGIIFGISLRLSLLLLLSGQRPPILCQGLLLPIFPILSQLILLLTIQIFFRFLPLLKSMSSNLFFKIIQTLTSSSQSVMAFVKDSGLGLILLNLAILSRMMNLVLCRPTMIMLHLFVLSALKNDSKAIIRDLLVLTFFRGCTLCLSMLFQSLILPTYVLSLTTVRAPFLSTV